jgi:hypothetical protein
MDQCCAASKDYNLTSSLSRQEALRELIVPSVAYVTCAASFFLSNRRLKDRNHFAGRKVQFQSLEA